MSDKETAVEFGARAERKPFVRAQCASLGLFCFGVTTMLGMSVHAEWTEKPTAQLGLAHALVYGGSAQIIAGVLELIRGNAFGGTAFVSYGAFWVCEFMFNSVLKTSTPLDGVSFYLGIWGLLAFALFCLTLKKTLLIQLIFGTMVITFFLLSAGVRHKTADVAGGYVGLLCGFLAFYAGVAELAVEEYGIVLPGHVVWYKPTQRLPY